MSARVLSLPGWNGSGPEHWQTRWERLDARVVRVEQASWTEPSLPAWRAGLLEALRASNEPTVLVGHSLGALLAVDCAAAPEARGVVGALLVAPPALASRDDVPPAVRAFGAAPRARLPFPSTLVVSDDDPFSTASEARAFAEAWGSQVVRIGARGHVDADSALGTWPEGFELLRRLRAAAPFTIDPRLAADTHLVGHGPLSELRLYDDARYPWFVLVPRRAGAEALWHLDDAARAALTRESAVLLEGLEAAFAVDKVNVGALGNVVRQLHVHHVGRRLFDPAWPGPVWGHSARVEAPASLKQERVAALFAQRAVAALFSKDA